MSWLWLPTQKYFPSNSKPSDTTAELCRIHTCFNVPHGMIHVHVDGPDATLVSLNIRLAAISTMRNVKGENLIFEMDNTPSGFSTVLPSLLSLSLTKNDLFPRLARDGVDLRSNSGIHQCS